MKIAIVVPWYGEKIAGGAERYAYGLAKAFYRLKIQVEVLTTCGKDSFSGWDHNHYQEGTYVEDGVTVRRFRLRKRNKELYDQCFGKLIQTGEISYVEELQLQHESVNSDSLYEFIKSNCSDYIFLFLPYYYGTFVWGAQIAPQHSFLIPCLHDEEMAHLKLVHDVFKNVQGCFFNTEEEKAFAQRIYNLDVGFGEVTGVGVEIHNSGVPVRFRRKFCIESPYLLYVGRKVEGKNVHLLIDYFKKFKKENPCELKLVLIGKGDLNINQPDIIDLGELEEEEKLDAMAGAIALCQPSLMESFSIVLMEAWLSGIPVVVNGESHITKAHVERSNGGLCFIDSQTFDQAISRLVEDISLREDMAQQGMRYVKENYSWDVVIGKMLKVINKRGFHI